MPDARRCWGRRQTRAIRPTDRPLLLALLLGWVVVACMGDADAEPIAAVTGTPVINPPQATATLAQTAAPDPPAPTSPSPLPSAPPPASTAPAAPATLVPSTATNPVDAAPQPTATTPPPEPAAQASPTQGPPAPAPVIVIDPAHDPTAPGALGIEYREVLTTALYTKAALEEAGYTVHLTRYNNDTINQNDSKLAPPNGADFHPGYSRAYAQASAALQYDPDLVIVLHYNGIGDPTVGGIEVYYCEEGSDQNVVLAGIVLDELVTAFRSLGYEPPRARVIEDLVVARGNRHFPSLGNVYDFPTTWLENRYAHIPVVLTEPLYMTNPTERALLEDPGSHLAFADAYVRAIDRYFGR